MPCKSCMFYLIVSWEELLKLFVLFISFSISTQFNLTILYAKISLDNNSNVCKEVIYYYKIFKILKLYTTIRAQLKETQKQQKINLYTYHKEQHQFYICNKV